VINDIIADCWNSKKAIEHMDGRADLLNKREGV
jgi:hypothetical protein